ncbi:hypothetical protein [Thalassotalea fusca]
MKPLAICFLLLISPITLANQNVLPEPWYQVNVQDYEAGVMFNEKDNEHVGLLKSKYEKTTFGSVLQHSSPKKEWLGKRIKLSAKLKTVEASEAVMFMTIKHSNFEETTDFMTDRKIIGTTDWKEYSIVLDFDYNVEQEVLFGVRLYGTGEVYFDEFSFEEVGYDVLTTASSTTLVTKGVPSNLSFSSLVN